MWQFSTACEKTVSRKKYWLEIKEQIKQKVSVYPTSSNQQHDYPGSAKIRWDKNRVKFV